MNREQCNPHLAFVFPGQGSQSTGMLGDLAAVYPVVGETFAAASEVLGYDLWRKVSQGPEEALNETSVTQPAMLVAGVAVWRVWRTNNGDIPVVLAGHSLGEYTALVCSGALELAAAVPLVAQRGRYMQQAVPSGTGAMAAILGLDDAQVIQACHDAGHGEVVSAVNFNAPGQVVIAGHADAVGRTINLVRQLGAKRVVPLPVSVPSHCALMTPAADKLRGLLAQTGFSDAAIPVISNVDVAVAGDADGIRDALVRQLHRPVRWVEIIVKMVQSGAQRLVECGPGKVLTGLNKRIVRDIECYAMYDCDSLNRVLNLK